MVVVGGEEGENFRIAKMSRDLCCWLYIGLANADLLIMGVIEFVRLCVMKRPAKLYDGDVERRMILNWHTYRINT